MHGIYNVLNPTEVKLISSTFESEIIDADSNASFFTSPLRLERRASGLKVRWCLILEFVIAVNGTKGETDGDDKHGAG